MAHPELQLISHMIRHGAMDKALEWGLREDDFITDEGRHYFLHMLGMRKSPIFKGAQPGPHAWHSAYPAFQFCDDDSMTLEAHCVIVRKRRLKMEVEAYAHELAGADEPTDVASKIIEKLQRNVLAVGYGTRDDIEFTEAMTRAEMDHDLQAEGFDMSIGKWPWTPFNDTSGGLQSDDYIVFYGRPKSKKSWVLSAFAASLFLQGKRPLIYTKEMTADNLLRRVGACIAGLPYQEFRTGRLDIEERARLRAVVQASKDVKAEQNMICLNGKDSGGNDTIEWLQAKVKKYKPNAVFIDGLYLMNDSRGSKNQKDNFRVQNISRAARQMVLETGVPVIATMQATRAAAQHKSANLDEIAYSDAIAQDVTAAIRVINEDEEEKITLVVGGSREYRFSGCQIWGKPATDFSFIRSLNQHEIDKIKARDERGDEKEAGVLPNGQPRPPAKSQTLKKQLAAGEKKLMNQRFNNLRHP